MLFRSLLIIVNEGEINMKKVNGGFGVLSKILSVILSSLSFDAINVAQGMNPSEVGQQMHQGDITSSSQEGIVQQIVRYSISRNRPIRQWTLQDILYRTNSIGAGKKKEQTLKRLIRHNNCLIDLICATDRLVTEGQLDRNKADWMIIQQWVILGQLKRSGIREIGASQTILDRHERSFDMSMEKIARWIYDNDQDWIDAQLWGESLLLPGARRVEVNLDDVEEEMTERRVEDRSTKAM